jgi:hypothetical protein
MTIDRRTLLVAGVLVALVAAAVWYLSRPDQDRLRIEARIAAFEHAVEQDDPDAFIEGIALDYTDRYGLDREQVTDRVFRETSRMETVDVVVRGLDIEIDRDAGVATAEFRVDLEGDGQRVDPDEKELRDRRRIRLQLRREGTDWVVKRAEVVYGLF